MLSATELKQQISSTIGKEKVAELTRILRKENFALIDLINLSFYENKDIAFRAAWLLENVFLDSPLSYLPEIENLLKRLPDVTYPSCQRHYAKIIMHLTRPKAPLSIRQKMQQVDLEPIIEKLFDWLIDPKVKIAVKVFAAEALFNLRAQHNWITEELANEIEHLMRNGTAAIQSRGKKILKALGK